MNRRTADIGVGALVALVLGAGGLATWQAWRASASTAGMMEGMMTTSMMNTGPSPIWTLLLAVLVAAVVGGGYLVVRDGGIQIGGTGFENPGTPVQAEVSSDPAATTSRPPEPSRPALFDVLPEDERRILAPVVESPGLTQIELRDRSDFSKSKVSQTVSDLEKRGLLYRERQGRTFRVYPADDIAAER